MVHQVQNGETLSTIAAKYGVSVEALQQHNASYLDPNAALIGGTIQIPDRFRAAPPAYTDPAMAGLSNPAAGGFSGMPGGGAATWIPQIQSPFAQPGMMNITSIAASSGSYAQSYAQGADYSSQSAPASSGPTIGTGARGGSLAAIAESVARASGSAGGWCLKFVQDALDRAGLSTQRMPAAHQMADILAGDPRFKEVSLTDEEIARLGPGAIVVSDPYNIPGNPYGHIAITLGGGREASDIVQPVATSGRQRVFIPV